MKHRIKNGIEFIIFTFPALIFVLFATNVPFFMNLYYSVFEWNGVSKDMKFIGMDNFIKIFTADKLFLKSALFTLKYLVFYVVAVNIIALVAALALSQKNRASNAGRAFYYIPNIISLTAISLLWKFIFGPGFEGLYQLTGLPFLKWSWIGTPKLAFYVIVIMTVWQNVGFYIISYIAGIISVPRDLMGAGKLDGATGFQAFWHITLPLIMPSITICLLTSLTFSFKLFDVIMVFTKGGPANSTVTIAYNIYQEAFNKSNYGLATAKSVVFVVAILLVSVIQLKISKNKEVEL